MTQSQTPKTIFEGVAHGRLDVMGGIADYSGSLVLQMPIRQETRVRITLREDFQCTLHSNLMGGASSTVAVDYRKFFLDGQVRYDFARQQFKKNQNESWIAYVIGCVLVLQKEKKIDFKGADFDIQSDVPLGKGVSSSASLEVATMKALANAYPLSFIGTELPRLAQRAENLIAGAPCGLMDQLTSFFGEPRKLLPMVCQPDQLKVPISLPSDVWFVGVDSGIRHSVGSASYADVRCSSFMGYSIIVNSMGVSKEHINEAINSSQLSKLPFGGYLCNIPVAEFETRFKPLLPASMDGKEFLSRYSRTIDPVTVVKERTRYPIYECTAHPVYENERVHRFMEHLLSLHRFNDPSSREMMIKKMGELMYRSHESYTRCGLGSSRTDEIVDLARKKSGIAGAKITGGGSGGTVCLLAVGEIGREAARQLHFQLETKYETKLALFEN